MRDDETDYLVVGAGAAAMAFTDALLTHTSATVTIVDRRHAPGGHWVDAYPYVRLHQPSAFYGVDSVPLGDDALDAVGSNAGCYERASAAELCAYFERVMQQRFLPTGRVRYLPCTDYEGEGRIVSRLSGATRELGVRRKVVDTTYLEGSIPATSPPPFAVADGVRLVTPGQLARLDRAATRFVVIGGGKTALDTCAWLLEQGVAPGAIRWIRPRDGWWLNRRFQQPHALLPELYRGASLQIEACAQATSLDDLFARLERESVFLRIDPDVAPTMFRGAIVSEAELDLLRTIEDVVRMGHVRAIERDHIVLDEGSVPTDERTVHVHCAARGLARPASRPIFAPGRVTVQPFFFGFACHQFAMLGAIEALVGGDDDDKNRLCPPIPYWHENADFARAFLATLVGDRARAAHPALGAWMKRSRLNPTSGIAAHRDDPRVTEARERIKRHGGAAAANLATLAPPR
ncbi:MAG: NAD(P)-binding protein [Deltaproteobacteria bacterium]|nr:NAD(P)-binding protein [Kofleriaceae bacterium]